MNVTGRVVHFARSMSTTSVSSPIFSTPTQPFKSLFSMPSLGLFSLGLKQGGRNNAEASLAESSGGVMSSLERGRNY